MERWKGRDKLKRRLKALSSAKAERLLGAALFEGGEIVATEAQVSITRGSVSGKSHVRSRPGEAPNNEFGELVRGIEVTQPEPLLVEVSANAPHSLPLEKGTSRMAARPFLRPARDSKRKEVRRLFARQVDRIAKGAAD